MWRQQIGLTAVNFNFNTQRLSLSIFSVDPLLFALPFGVSHCSFSDIRWSPPSVEPCRHCRCRLCIRLVRCLCIRIRLSLSTCSVSPSPPPPDEPLRFCFHLGTEFLTFTPTLCSFCHRFVFFPSLFSPLPLDESCQTMPCSLRLSRLALSCAALSSYPH